MCVDVAACVWPPCLRCPCACMCTAMGFLPSIPVAPLRPIKQRAARLQGWLALSPSLSSSPSRSALLRFHWLHMRPCFFRELYYITYYRQWLRLKCSYPPKILILAVKLCVLWVSFFSKRIQKQVQGYLIQNKNMTPVWYKKATSLSRKFNPNTYWSFAYYGDLV